MNNDVAWLLQKDSFGRESEQLREEIIKQGMQVFSDPNEINVNEPVIVRGTIEWVNELRKNFNFQPGIIKTDRNFMYTTYYNWFKHYMLNTNFESLQFKYLNQYKDDLVREMSDGYSVFIRPNSGDKPFSGQQFELKDFESQLPTNVDPLEDCIVAPPKDIKNEWRFLIADRQVVTGSMYSPMQLRLNPQYEIDRKAKEFAEIVVSDVGWSPDHIWTLDVCELEDYTYRVVEINSFACSGLYACNPKLIVNALGGMY